MANPVTLSPEQALSAMNTLTFADNVLLNMPNWNRTIGTLREELLDLRRSISRQYNAATPYVEQFCTVCGSTDRVLQAWEHNGATLERLCIDCRRAIIREEARA